MTRRRVYKVGNKFYFRVTGGRRIEQGTITKVTDKFCFLSDGSGRTCKKAKKNLFYSRDDVKLNIIDVVNEHLIQNMSITLMDLNMLVEEMMDKYPEKFI